MENQNDFEVSNYQISWLDFTSEKLSDYLDFVFSVDKQEFNRESVLFGYKSSDKILKPKFDGTELEADRLASIAAYQSKGFNILDITPGFLDPVDYACDIRSSWLFDGVNWMPDHNRYLLTNIRSVPISTPGNFLKIEFLQEINNQSNQTYSGRNIPSNFNINREYAKVKYQSVFDESPAPYGLDLVNRAGYTEVQDPYHYDNYARTLVWVSFNNTDQKPHLVKDGDVFNTYFDNITIHCGVGAPKIRITIGNNSTIVDGEGHAQINSQLHLTGSSRLMKKMDQVLQPFMINDANIVGKSIQGRQSYTFGTSSTYAGVTLVAPLGVRVVSDVFETYGYSVLWVTKMRLKYRTSASLPAGAAVTFGLNVSGGIRGVDPYYYVKSFASLTPELTSQNSNTVELDFQTPVRIVIPPGSQLELGINVAGLSGNVNILPQFEIYGYALGGLTPVLSGTTTVFLQTTKFITDATFLDDFTFQYNQTNYG